MKKAISIIILFISFVIIYFLEMNFFSWFTIAGVKPNLFVILVLFVGLYSGMKMGGVFGIIIRTNNRYNRGRDTSEGQQ